MTVYVSQHGLDTLLLWFHFDKLGVHFVHRFPGFPFLETSGILCSLLKYFAISESVLHFFLLFHILTSKKRTFVVCTSKSVIVFFLCLISVCMWVRIILALWLPALFLMFHFLLCYNVQNRKKNTLSNSLSVSHCNTLSLSCNCPHWLQDSHAIHKHTNGAATHTESQFMFRLQAGYN